MDLDKIFNLFNDDDETSLLVDFSEHPLFWIGGFNKIIDNHLFFKQYTIKQFKNVSPDINIKELEGAGEELMFRKAWNYIKFIDLDKTFHVECLKLKADEKFINNLHMSILFFEAYEEYEKCALLKNIKDKVKELLD